MSITQRVLASSLALLGPAALRIIRPGSFEKAGPTMNLRMLFAFVSLAIVLSSTQPAAAQFQQIARLTLPNNGGAPQVAVGDVNGDGFSDLVVLAPELGAVLLYLGSPAGLPSTPTTRRQIPAVGCCNLPRTVVVADVNGDGLADVLVGKPGADFLVRDSGVVFVFTGMPSAPFLSVEPTTTLLPVQSQQGGNFGWSVAVGDFDGDGNADVLVGEPRVRFAFTGPGKANIFYGPIPPGNIRPNQTSSQVLLGNQNGDWFGYTVAAANVVGGIEDDAVIESFRFTHPNPNLTRGRVQVFQGTSEGVLTTPDATINPTTLFGEGFGAKLAAGDVDGDGFADLAITGGSQDDRVGVYLSDGSTVSTTPASSVRPYSPRDVNVTLADVTGDGLADLIIGNPVFSIGGVLYTGSVHIFAGSASPPGILIPELQTIVSPNRRNLDGFGSSVAIGNIFGSFADELFVVSPNTGFRPNEVFVFALQE